MPTITQTLELEDKVTPVLDKLVSRMDKILSSMSQLDSASSKALGDTSKIKQASTEMDKFASASAKASSTVRGTATEVGGFNRRLANVSHAAQIFTTMSQMIGGVRSALASVGLDVLDLSRAFERMDSKSNFSRVITRITKDSQKSSEIGDNIDNMVRGTSYSIDSAMNSFTYLANTGMSMEKSQRTVEAWLDAISGYGRGTDEDLKGVAYALQQINSAGKVLGQDVMQLSTRGIPVYQIFADAVGTSMSEAREALSSGAYSSEQFFDIMNSAFTEGTDKFTSVAGAAKSVGGTWKATFEQMGSAAARGQEKVVTGFERALAAVYGDGATISSLMLGMAQSVEKSLSDLGSWMENTGPVVLGFFKPFMEAVGFIKDHTHAVQLLSTALGGLLVLGTVNKLTSVWQASMSGGALRALITNKNAIISWSANLRKAYTDVNILTVGTGRMAQVQRGAAAVLTTGMIPAVRATGVALRMLSRAFLPMLALEAVIFVWDQLSAAISGAGAESDKLKDKVRDTFGSSVVEAYNSAGQAALNAAAKTKEWNSVVPSAYAGVDSMSSGQAKYAEKTGEANRQLMIQKGLLEDTSVVDTTLKSLSSPDTELGKKFHKVSDIYTKLGINTAEVFEKAYQHSLDPNAVAPNLDQMAKDIARFAVDHPIEMSTMVDDYGLQEYLKIYAAHVNYLSGPGMDPQALINEKERVERQLLEGHTAWFFDAPVTGMLDPLKAGIVAIEEGAETTRRNIEQGIIKVGDGIDDVGAAATGAAGEVEGLSSSLSDTLETLKSIQALNDPFLSLQDAQSKWEELKDEKFGTGKGQTDLGSGKKTKGGRVNLGSEAGRSLNTEITERVSAAEALIAAKTASGATTAEIQKEAARLYGEVKSFMKTHGVTDKEQQGQYIDPNTLVPPAITTTITADTTEADASLAHTESLIDQLGLKSTNFIISADGSAAYSEIDKIGVHLSQAGNVRIIGDTTPAIESVEGFLVQTGQKQGTVKIITDKAKLQDEVSYLETKINDATRDRTVHVAISPTTATGADKPGKAAGGPVTGPGGPRDDKIPAMLSDGEWVVDAGTVHKAGGFSAMRNLTRALRSGAPQYASGGGITKRTYKATTLRSTDKTKDYVNAQAERSYVRNFNNNVRVPITIGNVSERIDMREMLREIEKSVQNSLDSVMR
jgi:tape measure domain-containing protein